MLAKSTGIVHVNSCFTKGGQGAARAQVCLMWSLRDGMEQGLLFSLESPPGIPGVYKAAP